MSNRVPLPALIFAASLFIAACGGGGSNSDGGSGGGGNAGTGGSGGTDGAGGTGGGQAACNTIVNSAPTIMEMQVAESSVPPWTGGTIVPGTYYLTARTIYTNVGGATGPTGSTRKQTEVIAASTGSAFTEDLVLSLDGGAETRSSFTATPTDTSIAFTYVCPTADPVALPYTVSGNTLTIAVGVAKTEVHTRQP